MPSRPSRTRTVTLRPEPRISVNKLGEYLIAGASRRRQILRDQKRPPDFKIIRYADAQQAIADYFLTRHSDPDVLARHLSRLNNWSRGIGDSDFDAQKNQSCRDAIQAFAGMTGKLDFPGLTITAGRTNWPKLTKAGVTVSVHPDFVLHGVDRAGKPFVGGLKVHISKTFAFNDPCGEYVGTMLHEFVETHMARRTATSYRHCYVLDVFAAKLFVAPKNFIRRRSDVEAACEEITILWDSI